MPTAKTLENLYFQELGDLVSSNEQMGKAVDQMASRVQDPHLKSLLQNSVTGIDKHTQTLRSLIKGEQSTACKGMEGLVEEAGRHALDADMPAQLRDVAIIAQYQRMSHYGMAGFGTAAAYAKALGRNEDSQKLSHIVSDIYRGDQYASQLAENAERAVALKS